MLFIYLKAFAHLPDSPLEDFQLRRSRNHHLHRIGGRLFPERHIAPCLGQDEMIVCPEEACFVVVPVVFVEF